MKILPSRFVCLAATALVAIGGEMAVNTSAQAELVSHTRPAEWDVATFIPDNVVNKLLQLLQGTSVPLNVGVLGELDIEIQEISLALATSHGVATPSFQFAVRRRGGADALFLKASGEVSPGVFVPGEAGRGIVSFPLSVTGIQPGVNFKGRRFLSSELISEITATAINRAFEDNLVLRVPLPVDFNLPLKSESELSLKTVGGGRVNVRVTTPDVTISRSFETVSTIFCPSGLWICADFRGHAAAPAAVGDKPVVDPYEAEGGKEAKVFVSARMIEGIINEFGALPPDQRRAGVQVTGHHGSLFEKRMQANGLGKGGLKIWLADKNGHGDLTVSPHAVWNKAKGMFDIQCGYQASAEADIHVHVDPLISGGVGTTVKCDAKPQDSSVQGSMGIRVLANENVSAVALTSEFDPRQSLTVKASTNGNLRFDFIGGVTSIAVPNIGVKVELAVPPDIVPTIPLLTNAPIRVPLPRVKEEANAPSNADPIAPYVVISPKDKPLFTEEGFVVGFDVNLVSLSKTDADTARKQVQDGLDAAKHPKLELGNISLLVGDLEFGKNNDLIKALIVFVKGASEVLDSVAGTAKDVAREVGSAATNTGKEVKIGARNLEREGDKAMKLVGNGATHLGKEANNLGRTLARGVAGGAKKVKQKATDALNRPGHNLNPKNWKR